jgi:hypothetical protein
MKTIIYKLTVDDVQTIAQQEIDRKLTMDEILTIQDSIAEKINWDVAIAEAINEIITT